FRLFGSIRQILVQRHFYAVNFTHTTTPDINLLEAPATFLVIELVDGEYLLPLGFVDGKQGRDLFVVILKLGLVKQADGIRITDNAVFHYRVADNVAQFL